MAQRSTTIDFLTRNITSVSLLLVIRWIRSFHSKKRPHCPIDPLSAFCYNARWAYPGHNDLSKQALGHSESVGENLVGYDFLSLHCYFRSWAPHCPSTHFLRNCKMNGECIALFLNLGGVIHTFVCMIHVSLSHGTETWMSKCFAFVRVIFAQWPWTQ